MPVTKKAMTKGTILSLSSNQDVYERGERYYRDGKLLSYHIQDEVSGEKSVRATIEGNYKNYEVTLKLGGGDTLSSYTCSCQSHSIWNGACKHVVAALFAHADGHARTFSATKMKQHANALATRLEEIIYEGIDETFEATNTDAREALIKLQPKIHCSLRDMHLTFSIGRNRMYVIKNIAAFIESLRNGETVTYGQGLTFAYSQGIFDETSQKLLDFITGEYDVYSEVGKRLGRQYQVSHTSLIAGREIHLTPRNVDRFFDLFVNQALDCESDFGDKLKLLDTMPPLAIDIRNLSTGLVLQSKPFTYRYVRGTHYRYFLMDGGLYRLPKANGRIVNALIKSIDEAPSREVLIGGNDQHKFLDLILPQLKRIGVVERIEGEAKARNSWPLLTKMYFDSDGKDIIGRMEFNYGGLIFDALGKENEQLNALINRDVIAEYTMRRKLMSLGFFVEKETFRLKGDDMLHSFLYSPQGGEISGIESLRPYGDVFVSEDLQKKTIRAQAPKIGLRITGSLLKITFEDAGYSMRELIEALDAYRARKKFFRLKDGRFIPLEDETVSVAADFLNALDITEKEMDGNMVSIPSYRALYVDELTRNGKFAATHVLKQDKGFEALLANFKAPSDITLPDYLAGTLREYQKTGFAWLKTLSQYGFGGILADDMGLGKTLQVISVLASESQGKKPSLVVCPTSLLYNWANEIKRFAPHLNALVVTGTPERRKDFLKQRSVDVFITTYDMLKRDIDQYHTMDFAYIIADEAQNIKNPNTQAAKSLKEVKGDVRFALTGTPIENALTELWSIFDFIMPGYLYSATKFGRLFEAPIMKYNDATAAAKLRQQIAPFVLRRIKESVLTELPEKTETTLQAEMMPEQKKIYQANLLETIGAFDDIVAKGTLAQNKMRVLAQLTRLRQICCHPSLFIDNYHEGSGKLNLTLETIQLALESGHRVLLFSQFTTMLGLIKDALDGAEIMAPSGNPAAYFYLDGSIKPKERMEMTERFNAGERDIFLISLKAGGAGLNLTGADVVIHYDPWWNPSVMDQASDRAHRYGQKKAVQVFNIVAKDSLEERIMELQEKKRGLIDSVITEGGSFINALSEGEIRKLFD